MREREEALLIASLWLTPCAANVQSEGFGPTNVVDIFNATTYAPHPSSTPYTTATPVASSAPATSGTAPPPPQTSAAPHSPPPATSNPSSTPYTTATPVASSAPATSGTAPPPPQTSASPRPWSTAALSVARWRLAATSLPSAGLAFFAGGDCPWITPCTANNDYPSNIVDIFNATAGTWSTAVLSESRCGLVATSLPNAGLAFFAGGGCTCLLFLFELMLDALVCEGGCVSWRRVLCADRESMAHALRSDWRVECC
jgi:hypothetical protein